RGKPDPGQVGARRDGHDRIRPAAAAVAARREVSSDAARGAARGGHRAAGAARGGGPRLMRNIAVAGALALLAGCGTSLFDSKVDYKSAGTLPNLEVPPDLTAPARDTRFVVPEAGVKETDWPENRANIPEGGIRSLLGKFADQVYSTAERDKFRTRLDRTPDGKGTEIYISHRGMKEVYTTPRDVAGTTGQTAWQPRESDPGLEAEFLRRVMVRPAVREEKAEQLTASAGGARQ